MKKFLIGLFTVILLSMVALIFTASLERSVFQAGRGLWPGPWFVATLLDAYFGSSFSTSGWLTKKGRLSPESFGSF